VGNELITLVDIVLDTALPSACANGVPGGAAVDIAFIVQAVPSSALNVPVSSEMGDAILSDTENALLVLQQRHWREAQSAGVDAESRSA